MQTSLLFPEHLYFNGVQFVSVGKRILILLIVLLDRLEKGFLDQVGF